MTKDVKTFLSDPWYFAHIPKSGGTTFSSLFDRLFDQSEIFPCQLFWEVGEISPELNLKYQMFRGHFNAFGEQLAYRKTRNLTILRNPIDMAFSSYKHIFHDSNTNLHHKVVGENWSFEDFILSPDSKNLVSNRMTKFLQLGSNLGFQYGALDLNLNTFGKFRRKAKIKQNRPQISEKFDLALTYLKRCFWVGVLEDLPLSLDLLCYQIAHPPLGLIPVLNKSQSVNELSDSARAHLESINVYDMALLSWAKEQTAIKAQSISGSSTIDCQLIEKNYQQQHLSKFNKNLLDEVNFGMGQAMIGDQWSQREIDDISSIVFRWTGPFGESFIDFWVAPRNFELMVYINKKNISSWDECVLEVNGVSLQYTISKQNNSWVLKAKIQKRWVKNNGLLRLVFKINNHKICSGKDQKQVGIAVNRITLL